MKAGSQKYPPYDSHAVPTLRPSDGQPKPNLEEICGCRQEFDGAPGSRHAL
jgi:hypothetical protein